MRSLLTLLAAIGVIAATGAVTAPVAFAGTDDYPAQWRNTAQDSVADTWGEWNRECTSFVAWRLHSRNGYEMDFHADATQWRQRALAENVPVDTTPAIGAVAWWSSGHVAWVEAVSGGNVTVEEYNYSYTGRYSERTVSAGSPTAYLHFKDLPVGEGGSGQGAGVGGAHFFGKNQLAAGEMLLPDQYLASSDLQFTLILQNDGNLVLYGGGYHPLWATNTGGRAVKDAVMQADGNLVLYGSGGDVVWASDTGGRGSSHLQLQDDGNAVIYKDAGGSTWVSNTGGHATYTYDGANRLDSGGVLYPGRYLRSTDGRYALLMQADGNLVLYGPGYHVLWATNTGGRPGADATVQGDGNFVLYAGGGAVWTTYTGGRGPSYLVVQGDGNVVLYKTAGGSTWASNTGGHI
ncbi:CHAP domain-containing protein [Actinomadura sp. DC4]|uniref:CHAP domain-containing protein n=1 Tax=Actinomadura sp. DC4 TaxID=3055069 RepID=UPI0025AF480A|nr:CHAP domain-containing protein [Actinomadura sp. DC4]MDN3354096.1 CHAP domain-containing protein [Actinomadura sp. DC4]